MAQPAATSPKWEERRKAPCKECGQQGRVGKHGVCMRCGRMLASLQPDYARLYLDYLNWRRDRMVVKTASGRHQIETCLRRLLRLASARFNSVSEISTEDWREMLARAGTPQGSSLSRFVLALSPAWARGLVGKLHYFIASHTGSRNTQRQLRELCFRIMQGVVAEARVLKPSDITPQNLIDHRPEASDKQLHWVLGFFGRFLVTEGIWSQRQLQQFEELLTQFCPSRAPQRKTRRTAQVVPMVWGLIVKCGLSAREVRVLRVSQIESEGIRLDQKRFIPFGEGLHRISRHAVESYRADAKPREYVFYKRHRQDYSKPTSLGWLASQGFTTKLRPNTQRIRHFEDEFKRAHNVRRLHLHWRQFHKLGEEQARDLLQELLENATSFPIPAPYLLVALCGSRLLPSMPTRLEGGESCSFTWPLLLTRYVVTVTWPVAFASEMSDQRTSAMVAKRLYEFAWKAWNTGWGLRGGVEVRSQDRDILRRLSLVRVAIQDTQRGHSWAEILVQVRSSWPYGATLRKFRKSYLDQPLLEELTGGRASPRCWFCALPDWEIVDDEVRSALQNQRRIKGLVRIARKHNGGERQLLWHAGRLTRIVHYRWQGTTRYRNEPIAGHLASAPAASMLCCPVRSPEQASQLGPTELLIHVLLSVSNGTAQDRDLEISSKWVYEQLGVQLSDHEISLALNRLLHFGQVKDFGKSPQGFRVRTS